MSNFACIGLDVDEDGIGELLDAVAAASVLLGSARGVDVRRWEDPASGSRVVLELRGRELLGVTPSLASAPGATLGPVETADGAVSSAEILDPDGEVATAATFEIEERRLLGRGKHPGGPASLVALGSEVTVHEDEGAFERSRASLLDPDGEAEADARRLAAVSFISMGVFGPLKEADAYARLSGVVTGAERRVNGLTGDAFHVARVTTAGFETDVCLAAGEHPDTPVPGQVVSGYMFLVASLPVDGADGGARRRWWRRP